MAIHPEKQERLFGSNPLGRDFLQDCWRFKAALKPKPSTTRCCWDDGGGFAISKRLFTGLRLIFLLLDFPNKHADCWGQEHWWKERSQERFELVLPHYIGAPHNRPRCWIFWRRPDTTYCIPLLLWILDCPPPMHSLIHAGQKFSHHLWTRCCLHVAPRFKKALFVMLSQIAADSANIAMPESEKKFLWANCGLLTKLCTQCRAPPTSSSQIMTRSRLMTNLSSEVTGPRTMSAVSWNTLGKQDEKFLTQTIPRPYHIGHNTYNKQMLASTKTSLQGAKRQDVTYVRAAPRWRPFQLSLLLDKGLVLRPTCLNFSALDPPPFLKSIQQKTKQMQRRVSGLANDDRGAKNIVLVEFRTGSYGGQHRVREFLQKSTGVSSELSLQIGTPNLIESCQYPRPR